MEDKTCQTRGGDPLVDAERGSENLDITYLLTSNSSGIAAVRKIIEAESIYQRGDNSRRYDDIWILRFLLSHKKKVKDAAKAAMKTMHFREEMKLNELGDIRHRAPTLKGPKTDQFESALLFNTFCKTDMSFFHQLPDPDRGVVSYYRLSDINLKGIGKDMSTTDLSAVYTMYNESLFQIVDNITRRTGKLVKVVKVVDMNGFRLRDWTIEHAKKDAAANKISEHFYPQLLGAMICVNCPSLVSGIYKVVSPFYPQRIREKIAFVGKNPSHSEMNLLRKYVADKDIPEIYGGLNKVWPHVDELIVTFKKRGPDEQESGEISRGEM